MAPSSSTASNLPPPLITRRSARLSLSAASSLEAGVDVDADAASVLAGMSSPPPHHHHHTTLPLAPTVPSMTVTLKRKLSLTLSDGSGAADELDNTNAEAGPSTYAKRSNPTKTTSSGKRNKKNLSLLDENKKASRFTFSYNAPGPTQPDSAGSITSSEDGEHVWSGLDAHLPSHILTTRMNRRKTWCAFLDPARVSERARGEYVERARGMFWDEVEEDLGFL